MTKKAWMRPMLAKVGTVDDLTRSDCIFEPKLDGFRALCYVTASSVHFISRNALDITAKFPGIVVRPYVSAESAILDGEIVAYNKRGIPNISLLKLGHPAHYVVFDILMKDGRSLIHQSLMERKKILDETVTNNETIEKIAFTTDGKKLWRLVRKKGLEGVMAKQVQAHYYPAQRTGVWLKVKVEQTIECVIVGYRSEKRAVASLALGLYVRGKLTYIGNVGTGFSQKKVSELTKKLHAIRIEMPHMANGDRAPRDTQWVKQHYVAEVRYLEFTRALILRHASFLQLRTDKTAKQCTLEDQV